MNEADKALTQAAADAAGIPLVWGGPDKEMARRSDTWENWNPLADDGDALRLAVALYLTVTPTPFGVSVDDNERGFGSSSQAFIAPGSENEITRRAIVRAAAMLPAAKAAP